MVSQTKNKLDLFQKCRFEKMDFPKFEKQLRGDVRTAKPDCSLTASQVTDIEQHVSLWRLFERRGEPGLWKFVGRCALQRRASCAWAFEWVSWCRFVSVGTVCHGSCILHREDNRPHTVQAECLRPACILGLLAVCSLRADKQAQFATRRLFISLKNMLLNVGNSRRSQLNNPVSQSSPLGAVFKFWKDHFLKTALLEKVQFVFGLGHHEQITSCCQTIPNHISTTILYCFI